MTTYTTAHGPGAIMRCITTPRWGAIAGAAICMVATCKLMFTDVNWWSPSTITNDQAASIAALAVAVLSGHYCWPELKALRITGLALLVLAVASSWYVVTTSAGRTSESRADAASVIRKANERREAAKTRVDAAQAGIETAKADLAVSMTAYKDAQQKLTSECGTGKGKICSGRIEAEAVALRAVREARAAVATANQHYEDLQDRLSQLPAPRIEYAGYKHTAVWLASLPYVTTPADRIADLLATQIPGLLALICEFGFVVFSTVAARRRELAHRFLPPPSRLPSPSVTDAVTVTVTEPSTVPMTVNTGVSEAVATPASVSASFPAVATMRQPKPKRQRPSDIKLVHDAIERLGGVANSQDELAAEMQVHKSECHKRLEACGDFVEITKIGRCHQVRINAQYEYV